VGIDVVGRKALMRARKVSPEVSPGPRKERIGGATFYISCFLKDSYMEFMVTGFRCEVRTVKSTSAVSDCAKTAGGHTDAANQFDFRGRPIGSRRAVKMTHHGIAPCIR